MAVEPSQAVDTKIQTLSNVLREEGYLPKVDNDGDIAFKAQGHRVILFGDNEDPQYVRMACILDVESKPAAKCLQAANKVSKGLKVIKAVVVNETTVFVSAEFFFDNVEQLGPVFPRTIDALLSGVQRFWTELEKMSAD